MPVESRRYNARDDVASLRMARQRVGSVRGLPEGGEMVQEMLTARPAT